MNGPILISILKKDKESAMRLAQLLSLRRLRDRNKRNLKASIKATIKDKQANILALPEEERKLALQTWLSEQDAANQEDVRQAVHRMRKPQGRLNIHARAALALVMAALSVYFLVATPNLPAFPGWGITNDLTFHIWTFRFDTLFYIGLSFGWTALTLTRLVIILLNDADAETAHYIQNLREETSGRHFQYRIRWIWEAWLGTIPWAAIIAMSIDLALGYVVAEWLVSTLYHHGTVDGVVHNALIVMSQMWFGGAAWYLRSVMLYGLKSPQEKALGWIESQLEQIEEPDEPAWVTKWYRPLLVIRALLLVGALVAYLTIVILFYSGFLAKPVLTGGERFEVALWLGACGVVSGMVWAGLASMTVQNQGGNTRKQKAIKARKDILQIFLSLPVTAQSLFGSLMLQVWGHGYSYSAGQALAGAYQQGYQDVVGLLFPFTESGPKWWKAGGKERVTAFLNRHLPRARRANKS
jgi:hypothetical protein